MLMMVNVIGEQTHTHTHKQKSLESPRFSSVREKEKIENHSNTRSLIISKRMFRFRCVFFKRKNIIEKLLNESDCHWNESCEKKFAFHNFPLYFIHCWIIELWIIPIYWVLKHREIFSLITYVMMIVVWLEALVRMMSRQSFHNSRIK